MSGRPGTRLQGPIPNPNQPEQTMLPLPALFSSSGIPEQLSLKNRLQEYTQRSAIQLPVYQTTNEGTQHAPMFRSTVLVDGLYYTSSNTFSNRKAAEQDVARVALLGISQKIKDEGPPLIREDTVFCKLILNEYAVKMNLEKPAYTTIQPEGLIPVFVSFLVFNGATYTGKPARNKKEAEQLVAQAVILSILDSGSGNAMFEIIKSKSKFYAALNKVKDSCRSDNGIKSAGVKTRDDHSSPLGKQKIVEADEGTGYMATAAVSEPCLGKRTNSSAPHQPFHEFRRPRLEPSSEAVTPIVFVPPALEQPLDFGSTSGRKRRKNKRKSKKNIPVDAQFPVAVMPLSQVPSMAR